MFSTGSTICGKPLKIACEIHRPFTSDEFNVFAISYSDQDNYDRQKPCDGICSDDTAPARPRGWRAIHRIFHIGKDCWSRECSKGQSRVFRPAQRPFEIDSVLGMRGCGGGTGGRRWRMGRRATGLWSRGGVRLWGNAGLRVIGLNDCFGDVRGLGCPEDR